MELHSNGYSVDYPTYPMTKYTGKNNPALTGQPLKGQVECPDCKALQPARVNCSTCNSWGYVDTTEE